MTIVSELIDDAKFIIRYRTEKMKSQRLLNAKAPKAGEVAPDFTLFDITGMESVTLSNYREKKPVVLVFGSFT